MNRDRGVENASTSAPEYRGRGKPQRRGKQTRRGGTYAAGSRPAAHLNVQTSPVNNGNMGMAGRSSFTGPPVQPFLPFPPPPSSLLPPGPDALPSLNDAPWWNPMNPIASALPFMPPPPLINPNFPNPAMAGPMFNQTMPCFSPFNPMGALNVPADQYNEARYPSPLDRPRVERASKSPEAPEATSQYLTQASTPAKPSAPARPLLVILDLNGTLIYRKTRKFPPQFSKRVHLNQFLDTLMSKHKVMIWSSSQPKTVAAICDKLFSQTQRQQLVAEWGRDKLNLTTSQYKAKVQVYKTLETLWADPMIQATYPKADGDSGKGESRWDQSNTILIDDSKLKALSEPYNIIEIPEFVGIETSGLDGATIFPKVLDRLETLSLHDDVSKVLRGWSMSRQDVLELDSGKFGKGKITSAGTRTGRVSKHESEVNKRALRKAIKNERKEAKKARDHKSNVNNPLSKVYKGNAAEPATDAEHDDNAQQQHKDQEQQKQRSSSPGSPGSTQSENRLLDRLEESLNV